jgi:very-short-patch-repair endonuclease
MNWTEKHIKGLLYQKKIRSYRAPEKTPTEKRLPDSKSKALVWLEWNLAFWANEHAMTMVKEYKFSPDRHYRSDFYISAIKCLIEYEGGIFMERGGHNSAAGIQRDIDKYSLAQRLGFTVIRLTSLNYPTVLKTLNEMLP